MKKIFSLLLALTMLLSVGVMGAITASAAENENLCKTFNDTVGVAVSDYFATDLDGIEGEYEKVPIGYLFIKYVQNRMEKDGSLAQYAVESSEDVGGNIIVNITYHIPFEVFESKAKSIADYSGDLKEYLKEYSRYDSASDCVQLDRFSDGINQGHPAFVIGYNDNGDNNFTVYVQRMQYGCSTIEEVEEEFSWIFDEEDYNYNREKDIFVDYDGEYHLVHRNNYYIAEIKYENGDVFYNSIKRADNLDGISMITRDTVINTDTSVKIDTDGCSVKAENGVFPAGTVVTVEKITDGNVFTLAQTSLKDIASKMTVFEITAKNNNIAVQPNGKVTVTFVIPDGYNMDNLDLYFLSTDGKAEKLKSAVDKTAKTITTELSHFSTYVVVENEKSNSSSTTSQVIPQTGDTSDIIFWSMLALTSCGAMIGLFIFDKKKKSY